MRDIPTEYRNDYKKIVEAMANMLPLLEQWADAGDSDIKYQAGLLARRALTDSIGDGRKRSRPIRVAVSIWHAPARLADADGRIDMDHLELDAVSVDDINNTDTYEIAPSIRDGIDILYEYICDYFGSMDIPDGFYRRDWFDSVDNRLRSSLSRNSGREVNINLRGFHKDEFILVKGTYVQEGQ